MKKKVLYWSVSDLLNRNNWVKDVWMKSFERKITHTGEYEEHCEVCREMIPIVEEESDEDLRKRIMKSLED